MFLNCQGSNSLRAAPAVSGETLEIQVGHHNLTEISFRKHKKDKTGLSRPCSTFLAIQTRKTVNHGRRKILRNLIGLIKTFLISPVLAFPSLVTAIEMQNAANKTTECADTKHQASQRRGEYSLEAPLAGEGWSTVNIGHNGKHCRGLDLRACALLCWSHVKY